MRNAAWLDVTRVRAYLLLSAITMGIALARNWSTVLRVAGKPAPTDFLGFWSAARLALHGTPQLVYAADSLIPVQRAAAFLEPGAYLGFFYPPVFLLACLGFALLSYPAALIGFVGATLGVLLLGLRRLFPTLPMLAMAAFPAAMLNAATGQNGFLTAAAFAGAALFLDCRPLLAGICLGSLVGKPHLAVCVPVALLAARRFHAAAAAAATAASLVALSWAVFGTATWAAFFLSATAARRALEQESQDWGKLFSVFTAARLCHLGVTAAYAAQVLAASTALWFLVRVTARRPGAQAEVAMLATAAVFAIPHVLDYDLLCLLVPMGWMATSARRTGWLGWEKLALLSLYVATLLGRTAALRAGIPLGPAALAAMFAVVTRRALAAA